MSVNDDSITYEIRCAWANYLIEDIRCVSDLNYQQKAWVEGSIPGIIDSWDETICQFFDDRHIDEYLADVDPKFNFSQHQIDELTKLRDKADYYCSVKERCISPREILADSRWHEVVACAQETLKAFEGYEVPREDEVKV